MKEVINILFATLLLILSRWFFKGQSDFQDSLRDAGIGLVLAALLGLIIQAWENKEYLRIWVQSYFRPRQPVRVSMAYLFRIEIDGHFMLIRNHKNPARGYQPIGGVYKYLKAETASLFQKLGITADVRIPVDDDSRNDLRCNIRHRRDLPEFLRWFNAKKDREVDPWREFYEELIVGGWLSQQDFPYIQYCHCKSEYEGIKPPDAFNTDEFLYADIVELKPENSRQIVALKRLFDERDQYDEYMFATPEEIRAGRTANGRVILPHAMKILC